jgi:hypothetical protein
VEQEAREIVDSTRGKIDLSHARSIAQAQQEVLRARLISTAVGSNALATDLSGGSSPDRSAEGKVKIGAMELAVPLLRVLDRYERRALVRRNRTIEFAVLGDSVSSPRYPD